jgi:hypothetical protein
MGATISPIGRDNPDPKVKNFLEQVIYLLANSSNKKQSKIP